MTGDGTVGPLLGEVGERRLIGDVLKARYGGVPAFGDDCALLPADLQAGFEIVATTDPCPEPLVASLGWDDYYFYGWLLGVINFSDLAAAGARPLGLVVSYLLPEEMRLEDFKRLMDGVDDCCAAHGSHVAGGNIGDGRWLQLTGTAIGMCQRGRRGSRRGARAGDALLYIGAPGYLWSAALLKSDRARLDPADARLVYDRACRPIAKLAAAQRLADAGIVHAAIDISDGLYPSLEALCSASSVGAILDPECVTLEPLPAEVCRQAAVDTFAMAQLWGDWNLLVAVGKEDVGAAKEALSDLDVPCQEIGRFVAGSKSYLKRGGKEVGWHGVDAERFTGSSWSRSKLSDYLDQLAGPRSQGAI